MTLFYVSAPPPSLVALSRAPVVGSSLFPCTIPFVTLADPSSLPAHCERAPSLSKSRLLLSLSSHVPHRESRADGGAILAGFSTAKRSPSVVVHPQSKSSDVFHIHVTIQVVLPLSPSFLPARVTPPPPVGPGCFHSFSLVSANTQVHLASLFWSLQ